MRPTHLMCACPFSFCLSFVYSPFITVLRYNFCCTFFPIQNYLIREKGKRRRNQEERKSGNQEKSKPSRLNLLNPSRSSMAEPIEEKPTNYFSPSTSPSSQEDQINHHHHHHHHHHHQQEQEQEQQSSAASMVFLKIISRRRTWVCLFVAVYTVLLAVSWNFLKSVMSWYELTVLNSSDSSSTVSYYSGWTALYASALLGLAFGVLSMVAALAVAVPATLVTWISILVLLTFCGKPRRALVLEGKKLTADIIGFVIKVLIKEGNIVAALCAVLGYFAFVRKSKEDCNIDL